MVITKMGALLSPQQSQDRQNLLIGAGILFVNAWLSATSGICNEWLVKYQDAKAPLMLKSIQLYFWGTLVNLIAWVVTDTNEMSLSSQGISTLVVCIILNNAAVGLSVAFIMKYADNIVKCFSTAAAVFISAVLSSYLFNFPLDLPFVVGLLLYSTSFFLYFGKHNTVLHAHGFNDTAFFFFAYCGEADYPKKYGGDDNNDDDGDEDSKKQKQMRQRPTIKIGVVEEVKQDRARILSSLNDLEISVSNRSSCTSASAIGSTTDNSDGASEVRWRSLSSKINEELEIMKMGSGDGGRKAPFAEMVSTERKV
mmetsp:Transcript_47004/g.75542  ORF Transcript_47004/g.75542 Transcript_47004/m.75542 type:complete len:310 (+) Transcript_47004:618-1547(+)